MSCDVQEYQRGDTIQWVVYPRQSGETLRSQIKPTSRAGAVPAASVPAAATATVTTGTDPEIGDLWTVSVSTTGLSPGTYAVDEVITLVGGAEDTTVAGFFRLTERVTT